MKKTVFFTGMWKLIFILTIISFPSILCGQKPADFSGTWVQDKSKGNEMLPGYTNKLTFTQSENSIIIRDTFIDDNDKTEESEERSLSLDGKEVVKKTSGWKESESATLSADKKTLTIKNIQMVDSQVIESYEIYSLSDNGMILTLKRFNAAAKDNIYTNYYNKKN